MIIGITGRRLSGKSTVAKYLGEKYGFAVLGFTEDLLTPILLRRKKPVNRRSLIDLGQEIRRRHRRKDALIMLLSRKISPGKDYAIAGIRFPEEARYLRKRFGSEFVLIAVEASAKVRLRRAKAGARFKETGTSAGSFSEVEKLPTERIIPKTMKMADFWVNGGGTRKELERDADRIIKRIISR